MNKKKICIFTSNRADYDLLKPLLKKLHQDKLILLQIVVSGSHFSIDHGSTYKNIIHDGFKIDKRVDIKIKSNQYAVIEYIGISLKNYAYSLKKLNPNLVILLGDRYETFSFAIASMFLKFPIAHIGGGETTLGVIDENLRHSITKMSYIHFVYHDIYKKRIMQMGEDPKKIYNYGSIGSENISKLKFKSKKAIEKKFKFNFLKKNLLITFHPSTLEKESPNKQFEKILKSLDVLKDTFLIFTSSNIDLGGQQINKMINLYTKINKHKSIFIPSMGQTFYFSSLKHIDALIGNSSSGIYETAQFKIGVVNIGKRQKGRLQNKNIINCEPNFIAISKAIKKLYSYKFQLKLRKIKDNFDKKNTVDNIYNKIKSVKLPKNLYKPFFDI